MRILLLCSAFNGLSQRAWTMLRAGGHQVTVQTVREPGMIAPAVAAADPELILCPYLRQRVPDQVWRRYRTIIIHPGPPGDRGPSALDWAIMNGERQWGVTALQATGDLDAGPIWAWRAFEMPADPPRKSALYNAEVADAAMGVIGEVLVKAEDPGFTPQRLDYHRPEIVGRARPLAHQSDRSFSWSDRTAHIVRRIRAADGRPGVRTMLAGVPVAVFDAHPGSGPPGEPGTIVARRHGAVLVSTGDGTVWIGQARRLAPAEGLPTVLPPVKLPAALALGRALGAVPEMLEPLEADEPQGFREITYRRVGKVGVVRFDFYNGAMSTAQCNRLAAAIRHAAAQDSTVLVLQGGEVFSNGMHLGVIEAHRNPASEAWRNINAINEVCHEIITRTDQVVIAALAGNAGAGGVMLALGADRVIARDGVMLNPHYQTMGLFGSEYWTYVLPRRVGDEQARQLTSRCEPISAAEAAEIGLVDAVAGTNRAVFETAVLDYATHLAADPHVAAMLDRKRATRTRDERRRPLDTYRVRELAEMSHDIFDNRNGFAQARRAFLTNQPPAASLDWLPTPRVPADQAATAETARPGRWSALTARLAAWR